MNKGTNLLGIANRAGKILIGEKAKLAINKGEVKLMLISDLASARTKSKLISKCNFYNVKSHVVENYMDISNAIGKENIMYIAIVDEGFAEEILKNLK